MPGAQVFETKIVARRLSHGSRSIVRSSFYMALDREIDVKAAIARRRLKPDPPSYGGECTNVPAGQLRVSAVPVFCQLSLLFSEAIPKRVAPPVNRRPAPFGLRPPVLPVPPAGD